MSRKKKIFKTPIIKYVIFDLDNTIEDWSFAEKKAESVLAKRFEKDFNIKGSRFLRELSRIKNSTISKRIEPVFFDRDLWFRLIFYKHRIVPTKKIIKEYEDIYWKNINKHIKLFPYAKYVFKKLRKNHRLAILTNSDGYKEIKLKRINKLGIKNFFDIIVTSDDVGKNKPDLDSFIFLLKKIKCRPEECVMIGDNPETDLKTAKEINMHTILMKKGTSWKHSNYKYYSDYTAKSMKDILKIIEKIEKKEKTKIKTS